MRVTPITPETAELVGNQVVELPQDVLDYLVQMVPALAEFLQDNPQVPDDAADGADNGWYEYFLEATSMLDPDNLQNADNTVLCAWIMKADEITTSLDNNDYDALTDGRIVALRDTLPTSITKGLQNNGQDLSTAAGTDDTTGSAFGRIMNRWVS